MTDLSKKMAQLAFDALEDKKAEDIKVLNIGEITVLADYFIIAGGTNRNQVQAMADNVEECLGRAGFQPKQIEGYQEANWILLDYGDVVVNVMTVEMREKYNIEKVWGDCESLTIG